MLLRSGTWSPIGRDTPHQRDLNPATCLGRTAGAVYLPYGQMTCAAATCDSMPHLCCIAVALAASWSPKAGGGVTEISRDTRSSAVAACDFQISVLCVCTLTTQLLGPRGEMI